MKRTWKKNLKGKNLKEAGDAIVAGYRDAIGPLPRNHPRDNLVTRGSDKLRQIEEGVKDVLTIEFNNPASLWLGPSAENSARGSAAKNARNREKSSPWQQVRAGATSTWLAQALADAAYRNFEQRLDLGPIGNTPTHMRQLEQHKAAYLSGFNKAAKYGDPNALEAPFRPDWQVVTMMRRTRRSSGQTGCPVPARRQCLFDRRDRGISACRR